MLNGFRGVGKSLLPSLLPIVFIGISSLSAYLLYKSNQTLKETVSEQRQVIGDLRAVNKEVRGLYLSVQERTDLIGKQSLHDLLKIESMYFNLKPEETSKLDIVIPMEVLEVLNGN